MARLRILVCLAVFLSSLHNGVIAGTDGGPPSGGVIPNDPLPKPTPPHPASPKQPADDDPNCEGDDKPTPPAPPFIIGHGPTKTPTPPLEKPKPSPNPPVKGPKPSPSPPVGKSPTPNPPEDPPCGDEPTPSPPAKAPAPPVEKPKPTPSPPAKEPAPPVEKPSPSPSPPAEKPSPAPVKQSPTPPQAKKPAPSPTPVKPSAPTGGDGETTSQTDLDAYLKSHNTVRAKHGAAPLVWNYELASKAKQWASNCKMVHALGKLGPYGENLAASAGTPPSIAGLVKMWTDEAAVYNPNNPVYSHFTQVVWKATTDFGCHLETCNNSNIFDFSKLGPTHFLVCEYYPQGNFPGQFGKNVQP